MTNAYVRKAFPMRDRDGQRAQTPVARRTLFGDPPAVGRAPEPLGGAAPLNRFLANELLASLPAEDFARLLPRLEPLTLEAGQDLYQMDEGVGFAYFPEAAVVSHLYGLSDGNTTEAAMVGREGLLGLSALFSAEQPGYWTRVLVPGSALRIEAASLREEFQRGGAMQRLVLGYAAARMTQLSQRAVCNGRHTVEERLCCWLLMLGDRAGEGRLELTHEQIAGHLGTRRAGITTNAAALRDAGIISYSRGALSVLDRQALEASACECYRVLRHTVAWAR
jgi:CRP-like cAMP-binding protein